MSKGAKIVIFGLGAAVGAVVSAIVTNNIVEKTYREQADEEINKAAAAANEKITKYKEVNKKLRERISRQKVTIDGLIEQLREYKGGDVSDIVTEDDDTEDDPGFVELQKSEEERPRVQYRNYASMYRAVKGDLDEEYDEFDPEEEEEIIRSRKPRMIDETTFSTTAMHYSKEDIDYYMRDGKVISEDGEYLDNYAGLVGEDWLSGDHEHGDEVYVRNDSLHTDYHITFLADFGEAHISHSEVEWED